MPLDLNSRFRLRKVPSSHRHGLNIRRQGVHTQIVLLVALALLCSCSRGNRGREPDWTFSTFHLRFWHGWCSMTKPVILDNVLYVGGGYFYDRETSLYAIDLGTRKVLWKYPTRVYFLSEVLVTTTTVYVGTGDSLLALNTKDGTLAWRHAGGPRFLVVENGKVFASGSNVIEALDAPTGNQVWLIRAKNMLFGPVALGASLYYVDDTRLYEVSQKNGALLSTFPQFRKVAAPRAIEGKLLFNSEVSEQPREWISVVLDPETRQFQALGGELLAYQDGILYLHAADGRVLAVEAATGRELWQSNRLPTFDRGGFVFHGNVMYQANWIVAGELDAFDQQSGSLLWKFKPGPKGLFFETPVVYHDSLFATNENCNLYMFDLPKPEQ